MIYTPLTKKAMALAYEAHRDQLDKGGLPYIYHPIHLAEQMTEEYTVCTALLHDVAEDTDISLAQLAAEGFPPEVTEALALLTHDADEPYMDYIQRLKHNPIAAAVKLADLRHNSDLKRLDRPTEKDLARAVKYKAAIRLLTEE